jgi:hypothetical protein
VSLIKIDETGAEKVIETSLTDGNGAYGFAAEPGRYKIMAKKDKYTISTLENQYYNFDPNKIYDVTAYEEGLMIPTVVMNIDGKKLQGLAVFIAWFKKMETFFIYLSIVVLTLGTILAFNNIIHEKTTLNYIIIAGYLLLWIINISLVIKKSPWSIVYEQNTGHPVPLTLVRIINKDNNKLVRTTVSDQNGKFSAVLRRGRYTISGSREGYGLVRPIVFNTDEDLSLLNKKLEMKKNSGNESEGQDVNPAKANENRDPRI